MSEYFDELELGLKDAVRRRAHLPWYRRVAQLSMAHRGLVALVAAFVIATPTVAAVGAVEGWFQGASDRYHPASATSGLGKVLPKGGRLLPIRVADPDGGPPWGVRLVKTARGETCIQVGRVVDGQIGALGIDGAWHDDHEFHEIKPNDQLADICGATDAAGNGFATAAYKGAPASVDVPLDNSSGTPGRCRNPYESVVPFALSRPGKLPARLKKMLELLKAERLKSTTCPAGAMRMVVAGLLGPDAKTITYRTPGGQAKTEQTSGGVGAYLLVFRETRRNCHAYTDTLFGTIDSVNCQSFEIGNGVNLTQPGPVTTVTYDGGRTCSDLPPAALASAFAAFNKRMAGRHRTESSAQVRAQVGAFFASHGLTPREGFLALMPQCQPVGWVSPKLPKLTAADVASPIKLTLAEAVRFCVNARQVGTFNGAVPCDQRVPKGDRYLYGSGLGQKSLLVTISFTARQPVTSANSYYGSIIDDPGPNSAGGGGEVPQNIRAGQRITLSQFAPILQGTYHGTVAYVASAGQNGPRGIPLYLQLRDRSRASGTFIVGRFSFRLPLKHSSP